MRGVSTYLFSQWGDVLTALSHLFYEAKTQRQFAYFYISSKIAIPNL